MIRNRSTIGRNSAGPRHETRRLTAADVTAERERIMCQPAGPAKVKALARCRAQMASIRNRVQDHG